MNSNTLDSPIIILGRGGSGTRLLSQLIQDVGIFLGNDINITGDSVEWVDSIYDLVINKKSIVNNNFNKIERDNLRINALEIFKSKTNENINHWGFKLPETMLCLPELMMSFPKAKIIHLIRHPVTLSLRRTHMTSRLDNPVGESVLKQAYEDLDLNFETASKNPDQINNAISWNYQVKSVCEYAQNCLTEKNYAQVKYEDICKDAESVKIGLHSFLNFKPDKLIKSDLKIDKLRFKNFSNGDEYINQVWDICEKVALKLGYEKYRL